MTSPPANSTAPQELAIEASEDDCGWYVLFAPAGRERPVNAELKRRGFEAWLPLCQVKRRRRKIVETVSEPLFPGYQFVRGREADRLELAPGSNRGHSDASWRELAPGSNRGLDDRFAGIGLLAAGDRPLAVPDREIREVRRILAFYRERVVIDGEPHPLAIEAGQAVALVGGVFDGMAGIFLAYSGSGRAKILLDMMGGARVVAIPEAWAIPTSPMQWRQQQL